MSTPSCPVITPRQNGLAPADFLGDRSLDPPVRSNRRVTQLDVARAAGVHNTTVSLALRNSPSIPEETRIRIQAFADQLGYRPDPALRALAAYRKTVTLHRRLETLAYVTAGATRTAWRDHPAEARFYAGAKRQAAEAGYEIEEFWRGEPGLTARRLSRMLFHRGIKGVLLAREPFGPPEDLDVEWSDLTVVSVGSRIRSSSALHVTADYLADLRLATRQAIAAGYTRPGLIVPRAWDEALDQALSIGFAIEQNKLPVAARVPAFFQSWETPTDDGESETESVRLARWCRTYQPDVLLGPHALLQRSLAALGPAGQRWPQVDPLQNSPLPGVAGVRQNCERIGAVAAELLINQLQRYSPLAAPTATTLLVAGSWQDGVSLPTLTLRMGVAS